MIKLEIEYRSPSSLLKYDKNSRTHSELQVEQIAKSITEFGFTNPILINKDKIIAGHGRLEAAKKLGMSEVPTIQLDYLSEDQIKALVIADNQLALNAGWDIETLSNEIEELKLAEFDIELLGFDDDFLNKILEPEQVEGLTDEDDVPEPPEEPVTRLGDLWILGNHRLLCGDSTSIDAVERLMDGQKADFCFTSPPYNAALQGPRHSKDRFGGNGLYNDGYRDDLSSAEYIDFNASIFNTLTAIASDNFICCYNVNYNKNSPSEYIDVVYVAKQAIPLVETIAWEKQMAVSLQGNNLTRIFEFVFVFCKGEFRINKNRTDCLKNLWKISNIGANTKEHKACFPVALVDEGIKNFCPHGGTVVEPFGGSGTTMISSEKLGCKSNLMELDPKYCDVIIKRWQDFTGKEAVLESSGEKFNDMVKIKDSKNANN